MNETQDAYAFYTGLGTGTGFSWTGQYASFHDDESANAFRRAYPDWEVMSDNDLAHQDDAVLLRDHEAERSFARYGV